jgi:hypothetical protein
MLCKHRFPCNTLTHSINEDLLNIKRKGDLDVSYPLSYVRYHWNLEPVCNKSHLFLYLFNLFSSSASKSVEIFWSEIYWGRLIFRAESSLIQWSCRSFIGVIVPYEISKANFRVETKILRCLPLFLISFYRVNICLRWENIECSPLLGN